MLRHDIKYVKRVNGLIEKVVNYVKNPTLRDNLKNYKETFALNVKLYFDRVKIEDKMAVYGRKFIAATKKLRLDAEKSALSTKNSTINTSWILWLIAVIIGFFAMYIINKSIGVRIKKTVFQARNIGGKITNGELIAYLKTNVSKEAFTQNREQDPMLSGDPNQVLMSYR